MESNFMREETRAMDKKDMTLLIEAEDAINDMEIAGSTDQYGTFRWLI